jgi:hypothetical protein
MVLDTSDRHCLRFSNFGKACRFGHAVRVYVLGLDANDWISA